MKKKIINGLLFAVALVAATSSFVSCKDYNGDNYAELQEKYATLQDAFRAQVQAMQDYVLTSRYNAETGYSPELLVSKGTIAKRLEELEKDSAYQAGQISNLDGRLTEYITENNLAVAKAMALAKKDSTLLHKLVIAWGDDLEVAVGKAAEVLVTVAQNSAKWTEAYDSIAKNAKSWNDARDYLLQHEDEWNEAYDSIAKRSKEWNKAVELANKANDFVKDSKYENIAALEKAFADADAALAEDIAALKQDINNVLKLIAQQVTGIEIQATENSLFGSFAYPVGVQSNVLAVYFGQFDTPVKFPAGDQGSSKNEWVDPNSPAVLTSELDAIGAPYETYAPGIQMVEGAGNAGYLYMTVNPSDVIMDGKEFTLRTSDNQVSKVVLSPLAASDKQLKWGYKRAGANGFYVASAEIKKEDAKDVAMSFDMKSIASDVKNMMQTSISASNVAKLAFEVRDAMKVDIPRLGVQAQWKDDLGWKNYVSKYEIAAFTVKPLGYEFLYNTDFSPSIVKFQNKLIAKEKAIAQEVINEIADAIKIQIGLPTTSGNVKVVDDKVYIVMPANSVTINGNATYTIGAGTLYTDNTVTPAISIPNADYPINAVVSATNPNEIELEITSVFNAIKNGIEQSIAGIDDKASGIVNKVLNKIINVENKIFSKVISVAKNPNRYIQPALIARNEKLGYFYPSRVYLAPTEVKRGQKIMFYPTTLTGEVVAPAFKKYVAVTGAWKSDNTDYGKIISMEDAKQYNTGVLNTVFDGKAYNIDTPFEYTVDAPAGTVLEFTFQCLGYNGKVAGKKYYIAVYE